MTYRGFISRWHGQRQWDGGVSNVHWQLAVVHMGLTASSKRSRSTCNKQPFVHHHGEWVFECLTEFSHFLHGGFSVECNMFFVFPVPVFDTSILPHKYCLPKGFIWVSGQYPIFSTFSGPFWESNRRGGCHLGFQTFCPGADHAGGYLNVCIRLL